MSEQYRYQAWELGDLPLHKLLSAGRKIRREDLTRTLRIAVLGDSATQHYCQVLSAVLKLRGWWPELYESEYGTIHQEVLNSDSQLYAHKPEFVIFFNCVQAIHSQFQVAINKVKFADDFINEQTFLWTQLTSKLPIRILQHTFALPTERPFGNQTLSQADTFLSNVAHINSQLIEAAAERRVLLIDTDFHASYYGKRYWFDERLWCQARQALSPNFLPSLVKAVSDTVLAGLGNIVKCVVVDLDNTMWGGILADDGADQIEIGQTEMGLVFQRLQVSLADLKRRGMLLAICSKNNLETVMSVLDDHPDMVLRRQDFVAIVANYQDKATNLLEILEKLNIGSDSLLFLDDSSFERDLVRTALPEVQVPELPIDAADYLIAMAKWNLFESRGTTAEDMERLNYYQGDEARATLRQNYSNLDEYLKDLNMKAEVLGFDEFTLPRITQLVQRSNQFNLTTIRYGDAELAAMPNDNSIIPFCIRLTDRLGDNGIVVAIILRVDSSDLIIDTWIMSCRVLGRGVEGLTLKLIVEKAKARGCNKIIGRYIPTQKNGMVSDLYERLGFSEAGQDDMVRLSTLNVSDFEPCPDFIQL